LHPKIEQRNDFRVHSSDLICGLKLSQPSFLGRSTSTSLPTASHKQGGSGGSRSFVFGRDDSNSSHGLATQPAKEDQPANEAKVYLPSFLLQSVQEIKYCDLAEQSYFQKV